MQVADHFSAVKRRFESRAMPAYEKPPAKLVDIYFATGRLTINGGSHGMIRPSSSTNGNT